MTFSRILKRCLVRGLIVWSLIASYGITFEVAHRYLPQVI